MNIFSVIKFPNDVCTGTNGFNGTCYTAEECTSKSGTSSGSCASGFGVCCTFSLSCGVTTSENNTYFEQTAFTTWSGDSPCKYKICPADGVCRIRLDLTTFVIAQPITRTDTADTGPGIGKCNVESMTVSSPGMTPPPEICGTNSGQHMFIDVNPTNCISVNINLDKLDTTTSRSWSIHAKQYSCGDTLAGPTGCLQYHTGSFGNFASFNWDMAGTTTSILSSTTHLAHQAYDICFRRESSMCRNCFSPKFTASFGVSFSKATSAAQAAAGASCTGLTGFADFVEIPGAQVAPVSSTSSEYTTKTTNMNQRICGLIFSNVDATAAPATASMTVCSKFLIMKTIKLFMTTFQHIVHLSVCTLGLTMEKLWQTEETGAHARHVRQLQLSLSEPLVFIWSTSNNLANWRPATIDEECFNSSKFMDECFERLEINHIDFVDHASCFFFFQIKLTKFDTGMCLVSR